MKKLFLGILLCVGALTAAAQGYDTIYNRSPIGYYSSWYDTCHCYLRGQRVFMINFNASQTNPGAISVISSYTPQPMNIAGGIVMEKIGHASDCTWDSNRVKPEYIVVYQYDETLGTMLPIDSARWDTAAPRIMKLPLGVDTVLHGHAYCYAYEARFKHPVMVDSTFYMGATQNNNVLTNEGYAMFKYEPVEYCKLAVYGCQGEQVGTYLPSIYEWVMRPNGRYGYYGGVIPILDTFRLEVATSDSSRGSVTGSGTYTNMTVCTISATAEEGYRFAHWDDGNRDNPRQVLLTQDTMFTAYFVERYQVWADVRSNDEGLGTATGGGVYYGGDTATLTALPLPYNKFLYWNDAVRDNPRLVELVQDTQFTAIFAPFDRYSVEAVANNSDRGRVVGGGEYYEGDTVTLTALPWMTFGFLQWDDGDTANPRSFVVTQDTVFTAIFVSREEIAVAGRDGARFSLMPNPTRGQTTVTLTEGFGGGMLRMQDAAGREVLRRELSRGTRTSVLKVAELPAGTYFVTLTTAEGTSTQRLVLN